MFAKKGHLPQMQDMKWDCFDNPTTYLPYMEGKAMSTAR